MNDLSIKSVRRAGMNILEILTLAQCRASAFQFAVQFEFKFNLVPSVPRAYNSRPALH